MREEGTKLEQDIFDDLERILQSYASVYLPGKEVKELTPKEKILYLNRVFRNRGVMGDEGPREFLSGKSKDDWIGQNRRLYLLTRGENGMQATPVWFGDMYTTDAEYLRGLGVFVEIVDVPYIDGTDVKRLMENASHVMIGGEAHKPSEIPAGTLEEKVLAIDETLELAAQRAARHNFLKDLERLPDSLEGFGKLEKEELKEILMSAQRKKWLSFEIVRREFQRINKDEGLSEDVCQQLLDFKKNCLERLNSK